MVFVLLDDYYGSMNDYFHKFIQLLFKISTQSIRSNHDHSIKFTFLPNFFNAKAYNYYYCYHYVYSYDLMHAS